MYNAKMDKDYMVASKYVKCFGLQYTVCLNLSRIDDVVRVIEGKNI